MIRHDFHRYYRENTADTHQDKSNDAQALEILQGQEQAEGGRNDKDQRDQGKNVSQRRKEESVTIAIAVIKERQTGKGRDKERNVNHHQSDEHKKRVDCPFIHRSKVRSGETAAQKHSDEENQTSKPSSKEASNRPEKDVGDLHFWLQREIVRHMAGKDSQK